MLRKLVRQQSEESIHVQCCYSDVGTSSKLKKKDLHNLNNFTYVIEKSILKYAIKTSFKAFVFYCIGYYINPVVHMISDVISNNRTMT